MICNHGSEYRTKTTTVLSSIGDVLSFANYCTLNTFAEMWWQIFLWALFSSIFVHTAAAIIAFGTLRKHHFGKYCPIFILIMGVFQPLTSGIVSSAMIALVYSCASMKMAPVYAMFWGVGQTLLSAAVGFTRILATLWSLLTCWWNSVNMYLLVYEISLPKMATVGCKGILVVILKLCY